MGPVSAFAFSVCGWVRFEALGGWAGVAGAATGQGAQPGQQQGAGRWQTGQEQGQGSMTRATPPLPTYLWG